MAFNPGPEIISHYFPDLSTKQVEQFKSLGYLYSYWNQRINLISRKDLEHFYQHHVLHSLGIAKVQDFKSGNRALDVGTGGGFPGIPLAILFPDTQFHLIDSIGKKIKVVEQVINELGLGNATCEQIRVEHHRGQYDFVVCRAVTQLKTLLKWTEPLLVQGGKLVCLKGGNLEDEVVAVRSAVRSFALSEFFHEPFFETKKVLVIKR